MISTGVIDKNEVYSILSEYVQDVFSIDEQIVASQINKIFDTLNDEIKCFIEYPYVDKFHRDSYYNYFSKKHNSRSRDSIRVSLFKESIDFKCYFQIEDIDLQEFFLGYITIRPTTFRIIGHSFISPKALKSNNFVCCLSRKTVSIFGRKISVYGFPYCSQDNESITCSEATLINVMDYFSHKYPEYTTLLPSQVAKILSKQVYERQLPAHGLSTNSISYVLKKMGFGTVVYSCDYSRSKTDLFKVDEFKELMYMYIESGIPIIATLSSKESHHAVIIMGREEGDTRIIRRNFFSTKPKETSFSNMFDSVLVMNDNNPPYEILDFNKPLFDKHSESYYKFASFIVPLYSKVFLDASQFKPFFFQIIQTLKNYSATKNVTFVNENEDYIYRLFLTSSKSYKEYIAKSDQLSNEFKTITISKRMPKFIWVGEIIKTNNYNNDTVIDGLIVVDATESGLTDHLIFACNSQFLIIKKSDEYEIDIKTDKTDKKYIIIDFEKEIFLTFANNLKGKHTKWQS